MIETIGAGIGAAGTLLGWLRDLRGLVSPDDMIAAQFDAEGNRKGGNESIKLHKVPVPNEPKVWFFMAVRVEGFHFVPVALVPEADIEYGMVEGQTQKDGTVWRWTAPLKQGMIHGLAEGRRHLDNFAVPFIVVGYRPKALLAAFAPGATGARL